MNESYEELLRERVRYRFEVDRCKTREKIKDEKIKNLIKANWTLNFEAKRLEKERLASNALHKKRIDNTAAQLAEIPLLDAPTLIYEGIAFISFMLWISFIIIKW